MASVVLVQIELMLMILKVLLASLSVLFLFGFFVQWKFSRYRLPVIAFYTKKRFVKHNIILGTGVIALSLAYIIEFFVVALGQDTGGGSVIVGLLETVAIVCIGYSYYKLVRLQIPE
ncbi:MAG: hypothetical protein ABIG39_03835 [Candidatus Micrarchaeota archaeon]